jgi:lipopolysaccharide export system protein LptC
MAIRTDFFTRIGISDGIETEGAYQIGGIEKEVHRKGMTLIFNFKKLNLILHTKVRGQMKSDGKQVLLTI